MAKGIIAHAPFQIASGKVEGINQKIKTLRRHGYGYPDDEYFFLKLFDASLRRYERNPKSYRFCNCAKAIVSQFNAEIKNLLDLIFALQNLAPKVFNEKRTNTLLSLEDTGTVLLSSHWVEQ